MDLETIERGAPVLLKARVIRVRDGKIEAQTADGQLVYCRPESLIDDKATAKKDAAKTARLARNPAPSPGFGESALA